MPKLIKMVDAEKTSKKIQYVDLGLVVLVSVLIVIVIFIVMKCKLKCGSNRESYIRTSSANDTQGSAYGYESCVDYAGCASEDIGWSDSPHYKANPNNKYLPLDMAPVDFYTTLRSLSVNFENDSKSTLTPPFYEFGQYFPGERAPDFPNSGEISVGNAYTNNSNKSRGDYQRRGNLSTSRALNNQPNQGNISDFGPNWEETLSLRKFDQLNYHADAPNAKIRPELTKYNKIMDNVIEQDLNLVL